MTDNIIVVGSGGREYAIIKKLIDDSSKPIKIICFETNKNDYISKLCSMVVKINDKNNILKNIDYFISNYRLAENEKFNFAIIGPENMLKNGLADLFKKYNIPCIGPNQKLSKLETSKSFCRDFLKRNQDLQDYSPIFEVIDNKLKLEETILKYDNEIVIKRDGLFRGKGVYVENIDFTRENINDLIETLGNNERLVIEEKFYGQEYSLMSLVDCNGNMSHFPPIKDYKRLKNDNQGCNTGGMGCIIGNNNILPYLDENDVQLSRNINKLVIENLNKESEDNYVGILYGSFIKTPDGEIKIIEYNCRFGDPECILALNLLETNFYNICSDLINGTLNYEIKCSQNAGICVYVVPKSYCSNAELNKFDIYFDETLNQSSLIYSNIEIENEHIYSLGSRCLALCINKPTLYEAYHSIYNQLSKIKGYLDYRTDIGAEYLSKYEVGGVSIELAEKSLSEIKKSILSTYNKNVVSDYGSFGGELKLNDYILVSSIDGVGTKSILAKKINGVEGFFNLGRDIVAHSINDILVQGAEPLFFLDYFGTNSLNTLELVNFINGVADYCNKYGQIPILGGETAEMGNIYNIEMTDLVGCIIGLKNKKFFKNNISKGDVILNIPSDGPHTNGFTLINKLFDQDILKNNKLIEKLLIPHRCYLDEINEFVQKLGIDNIHGLCHITGGGINGNLKRIVKEHQYQLFDKPLPDWCQEVKELSQMGEEEIYNVFNCGYGFVVICNSSILSDLNKLSFEIEHIGNIL